MQPVILCDGSLGEARMPTGEVQRWDKWVLAKLEVDDQFVRNVGTHSAKPTLLSWVPHVLVFIVPRQMVTLGDHRTLLGSFLREALAHAMNWRAGCTLGESFEHSALGLALATHVVEEHEGEIDHGHFQPEL